MFHYSYRIEGRRSMVAEDDPALLILIPDYD